jgi:hypothetical protein
MRGAIHTTQQADVVSAPGCDPAINPIYHLLQPAIWRLVRFTYWSGSSCYAGVAYRWE